MRIARYSDVKLVAPGGIEPHAFHPTLRIGLEDRCRVRGHKLFNNNVTSTNYHQSRHILISIEFCIGDCHIPR